MPEGFKGYATERGRLLDAVTAFLQGDERFVAAWLGGSYGRGEADDLSDLDVHVVVSDEVSEIVCRRERQVMAGTTPERLAIFSQIGTPGIIHENHNNAPANATFTAVVYEGTAQQIDWTLIPHRMAQRQTQTCLLFQRASIPVCHPTLVDEDERRHLLAERHAFFWMMTVPTAKYALRGDAVHFHILLDMLHRTVDDIERLLRARPWTYQRGSRAVLAPTQEMQLEALRSLCDLVLKLTPELTANGLKQVESPISTIDNFLQLVDDIPAS